MQFLRGTENLFMDFAWQPQELFQLRDMLHEYNLKSLRFAVETDADGISFMDDWGTQRSLLISPKLWESFFKPMYREYCEIIRAAGKKVFFHSDGHIQILYPHLIEIGIDAVNSQLFCMDIEEIGRQFQGKISFWGEIDRQQILPFGTVEEVRQAVRRVRKALDNGQGGLIAQCEWGLKDPKENIEAVFETWLEE
jgi:uroporphyrinogen-III decarboxylase